MKFWNFQNIEWRNEFSSDGFRRQSLIIDFGTFQISKKQHELVKSMKQSGKSIQSKSLTRVLGNLDGLRVQPYEVFEEEEKKKLHKHWLVCLEVHITFSYLSIIVDFHPSGVCLFI